MTYITVNIALFLSALGVGRKWKPTYFIYKIVFFALFLISAFRFEVGCDWSGYFSQYLKAEELFVSLVAGHRDPLWWGILHFLNIQELPYPVANVVSSAIFFAGVHVLARRQPNPLAFLVLLFPILIINMPMSAIRQGAAVGLLCVALAAFIDRKSVWCGAWILLASGFHSSAAVFLILLPLATGNYSRSRIVLAALLAIPGIFFLASGDAAQLAVDRYVETGVDAAGATFRSGVLVLSGLFFFVFLRRPWRRQFTGDFAVAHLFSMAMILLIAIVPVSSVIGDRLGYYLIPAQAMIFARVPYLDIPNRKLMTGIPYLSLALMFTVWVSLSWHFQQCYIPYQSWLFGFPNSSWSGL